MTFLIGFGILISLSLVLYIIENTAPTVSIEVNIFHICIIVCGGMFAWGAQEYVTTEWFDLTFREGIWVRVFQVLHLLLVISIILRGFVIGSVIAIFVGISFFVKWLIWG